MVIWLLYYYYSLRQLLWAKVAFLSPLLEFLRSTNSVVHALSLVYFFFLFLLRILWIVAAIAYLRRVVQRVTIIMMMMMITKIISNGATQLIYQSSSSCVKRSIIVHTWPRWAVLKWLIRIIFMVQVARFCFVYSVENFVDF